jgi:nucleoside-diphosphate-sugar epimerase
MVRVLVTGANGLLGYEVARHLVETGDEAICIGRTRPNLPGAGFIEADLNRPLPVAALPDRVDAVAHLAQSERFSEFPEGVESVFAVNVATPVALLDWARRAGAGAFVHASSGGVYGGGPKPFAETDPLTIGGKIAFYLSTKRAIEQLAEAYQPLFPVCALRFFFVSGARQRASMLMPRLAASVREGRALTLQGERGMALNPIHASDAARAVIGAIRNKARGIYNVGGAEIARIRDIGKILGRHLGKAPLFEIQKDAIPNDLVGDIARMKADLHIPAVSLNDGLREMCT